MPVYVDLVKQKFGLLTVVSRAPSRKSDRRAMWNCNCKCGNKHVVSTADLRGERVRSCGCLILERDANGRVVHKKI
jgi:hypothetical protein